MLDTDWCHVGSPYEDRGYLAMMTLRDYRKGVFEFDPENYEKVKQSCLSNMDDERYFDDFALYFSLFDLGIFESMGSMEKAVYQRSMVEELCRNI